MKSRKGALYYEMIFAIFSIAVIGIVLFMINNSVSTVTSTYNELPMDINYKFSLIFVNNFLKMELNKEDVNNFKNYGNIKTVSDLIYINTEKSKSRVSEYKTEYISRSKDSSKINNGKSTLELYANFAEDNSFTKGNLLKISKTLTSKKAEEGLQNIISQKNSGVLIKTLDEGFILVSFK